MKNQDDKLLKRIKGAKAVTSQASLLPSKMFMCEVYNNLGVPHTSHHSYIKACISVLGRGLTEFKQIIWF